MRDPLKTTTAFKQHLERLGYSKGSIKLLPRCLKDFLTYTNKALKNITSTDIVCYHTHLQERPNKLLSGGLSESYIQHHIYALKLFFNYCLENKTLLKCPISSLAFKSPTSQQREILTQEEIKTLYAATNTLKEKAVLHLFYGCGLRSSEGEKLNIKDIHFRSDLLYVREGKNSKRRAVPLSWRVARDIKEYALKERFDQSGEKAFITNQVGKRTSGKSYNIILKKILSRTEIKKEITLHCLRHSIATHLLESGLPVEYVRDFLGHKHLESTQIYTRVKNQQLWNLNTI